MKFFFSLFFIALAASASGQYYYKDIIGTRETREMMKAYLDNKVTRVRVNSYDSENTKSDAIFVEQSFSLQDLTLKTVTRTDSTDESVMVTYIDSKGKVLKIVDNHESTTSLTSYFYDSDGLLFTVLNVTADNKTGISEKEIHNWFYKDGKIERMLRIKNDIDTMYVDFKFDDKGNIAEEQGRRKGMRSDAIYYYYDNQNRITDIVRYNYKAKRLLPEYMFEYSPANKVIQRITVPATGAKYLIWRYQYDERGLKIREAIFDRYKQVQGRIEYLYSFAS